MKIPFPHQAEASQYIRKCWDSNRAAYLWMEMRTGKTFSTLLALDTLGPVLVICPKSVMPTWVAEFEDAGWQDVVVVAGAKAKRQRLLQEEHAVHIVNWDMVANYDALNAQEWAIVVADESRKLASPSTKTTKYMVTNRRAGYRKVLLSGAPASEGERDLPSQYIWGDGAFMGYDNHMKWLFKNYQWIERAYEWRPYRPNWRAHVQEWVKANSFSVRMHDVHSKMGNKLRNSVKLAPSTEQMVAFKRLDRTTTYTNDEGKEVYLIPLVHAAFERQICCGYDPIARVPISCPKFEHVADTYDDTREPMLVLSELTHPLDALADVLRERGWHFGTITGATPSDSREAVRREFMEGEYDIVLAQTRTVKMGLDFSRAKRIVYLSNGYSQDDRTQSEERATRLDKHEPVDILDVCIAGTLEPEIVKILGRKQSVSQSFLEEWYAGRK